MIRKHFRIILSICTFVVLFRTSTQFSLFSLESSDESDSSALADHVGTMANKVAELKPDERNQLIKNFLTHLLALSELHEDERKIEHDMLVDLDSIPKFEVNAVNAIKKFRKSIDAGRKALDRILEKRKNKTNPAAPEIMRNYETMWIQIETKKRDEAKSALENIDNILCSLGKSIVGTIDEQMKTLHGIQQIIKDREKEIDKESKDIRKHVESIKATTTTTTLTPSDSTLSLFLFDEKDVKEIREIYNMWIEKLPKLDLPETKNLLKKVEESGMTLPMFCKTLAELHVIRNKAAACKKRGDKTGRDVLLKTLEQPNYKKCEEIIEDSPPPSMETIVKTVRKNFLNLD